MDLQRSTGSCTAGAAGGARAARTAMAARTGSGRFIGRLQTGNRDYAPIWYRRPGSTVPKSLLLLGRFERLEHWMGARQKDEGEHPAHDVPAKDAHPRQLAETDL